MIFFWSRLERDVVTLKLFGLGHSNGMTRGLHRTAKRSEMQIYEGRR
jgi:hypothetical protein